MTDAILKSCPFCGGDAEADARQSYREWNTGKANTAPAVYCLKCGATISHCRKDVPEITLEMVEEMWNTRARAERYTVGPGVLGSWLVYDNEPPNKPYRSSWQVERDARAEAARLNSLAT